MNRVYRGSAFLTSCQSSNHDRFACRQESRVYQKGMRARGAVKGISRTRWLSCPRRVRLAGVRGRAHARRALNQASDGNRLYTVMLTWKSKEASHVSQAFRGFFCPLSAHEELLRGSENSKSRKRCGLDVAWRPSNPRSGKGWETGPAGCGLKWGQWLPFPSTL